MQFGSVAVHRELRNREEAGLSRAEVIAAAPGLAAREPGEAELLDTLGTAPNFTSGNTGDTGNLFEIPEVVGHITRCGAAGAPRSASTAT